MCKVECARLGPQCPPWDAASLPTSCSRARKGRGAGYHPRCRPEAGVCWGCLTGQPGWQILRWSWCGRRLAWAELSSRSERMAQEVPRPAQDPGFPLCNLEVWARASGLQVSLSQSCRLSSILLTPAQACFRLASSPVSLTFSLGCSQLFQKSPPGNLLVATK